MSLCLPTLDDGIQTRIEPVLEGVAELQAIFKVDSYKALVGALEAPGYELHKFSRFKLELEAHACERTYADVVDPSMGDTPLPGQQAVLARTSAHSFAYLKAHVMRLPPFARWAACRATSLPVVLGPMDYEEMVSHAFWMGEMDETEVNAQQDEGVTVHVTRAKLDALFPIKEWRKAHRERAARRLLRKHPVWRHLLDAGEAFDELVIPPPRFTRDGQPTQLGLLCSPSYHRYYPIVLGWSADDCVEQAINDWSEVGGQSSEATDACVEWRITAPGDWQLLPRQIHQLNVALGCLDRFLAGLRVPVIER